MLNSTNTLSFDEIQQVAREYDSAEDFFDYVKRSETEPLIIIQIEHIDCIDELEKIVQNPYVDGFIFGPNDLSGSISRLGDVFSEPTVSLIKKAITITCSI